MTDNEYLRVFEQDGSHFLAELSEQNHIDAAVSAWIQSGKTVDSVLHLDLIDGSVYAVLASEIKAWIVSTPERRQRQLEIDQAISEEVKAVKLSLGIPWDDE